MESVRAIAELFIPIPPLIVVYCLRSILLNRHGIPKKASLRAWLAFGADLG